MSTIEIYRISYLILVLLIALQRLIELRYSRKNALELMAKGGIEIGQDHFYYMKILHLFWILCCFVGGLNENFSHPYALSIYFLFLFIFFAGQFLRLAAMFTLGNRWTANIIVMPQQTPIKKGIYRLIRHPNYLGVILEIMALPLICGLLWPAIIFSLLNGIVLKIRIRAEERALNKYNGYEEYMPSKKMFIPRVF